MLFNSFIFIVFILLFFSFWYPLKKSNNTKWLYLTISSFIFYAWWDWRFLFLIIFSGLVDYLAGLLMLKSSNKRFWLILSLTVNIGLLSIFKYSTFFASIIDDVLGLLDIHLNMVNRIPKFALILPVGISFYTFQSMSYTIDIYRNRLKPTKNIFHFFAYLSMFPQLVAGPIIRAKDLLKQLSQHRKVDALQIWHGTKLVALGFFQKTVLADNIGVLVNSAYNNMDVYNSSIFWWMVSIGFALQIYFDFSGYSLIAKGIAKWMGYHFKMNFNHPYIAKSLKSFWQRWHISLSTWFRDYVYIPLGGNKKGLVKSILFMWITMLISGLWHGASITFLIWGGIHALFLSVERIYYPFIKKIPKLFIFTFTMFQVLLAWVFFRSEGIEQAFYVINKMFSFTEIHFYWSEFENSYYFLGIALLFELFYFLSIYIYKLKKVTKTIVFEGVEASLFIVACLFLRGPEQEFIYFQF